VGGSAVTIEVDVEGVPLWFKQMTVQKPVCMGHIGYDRVELVPKSLYALDTRAVGGGQLTGAVFPGGHLVQVPVTRNYHQEAHEAWLKSQAESVVDPMSLTLAQVVEVLRAEEIHKDSASGDLDLFKQMITALNFEGRTLRMRECLANRFGTVPEPGPERGVFSKNVKATFSEPGIQIVAVRLFRDEVLALDDLATAFPKVKLNQAQGLLERIENNFSKEHE